MAGSQFDVVADQMTGPLIYGFSEDAVAAAKVVADFAKTNDKLVIRGGVSVARPWMSTALSNLPTFLPRKCCWPVVWLAAMSPISRTAVVLGALAAKKRRRRNCRCLIAVQSRVNQLLGNQNGIR